MTCDTCLIVLTKVCLPPATEASTAAPEEEAMKVVFYEDDVSYYGCGSKKMMMLMSSEDEVRMRILPAARPRMPPALFRFITGRLFA